MLKVNNPNGLKMDIMENKMDKKGQMGGGIWALVGIGVAFVVVGIVLAFGLNIMADIKGDFTAGSLEANATADAQEGVAKITAKLPLIGTVVVAVLIIGLLIAGFMGVRR